MKKWFLLLFPLLLPARSLTAAGGNTPKKFIQHISHDGKNYTIVFRKVDFYTPDCEFLLHTGNTAWSAKSFKPFDHGPCRTYLGQVKEAPAAVAIGYFRADGTVRGKIFFGKAGRGTTLEFDRGRPTHNQDIIGKLEDSSFCLPPIDTPSEELVRKPSRRAEMGAEISFMNYERLGKNIPTVLEVFEFGFAPVFLTACADMKIRLQISRLVLRTNPQGCPYMTAEDVENNRPKTLPDGSTGYDSRIIREVWNKVWPEDAKKKKTVMGGSCVAAGGGNESSVRMEPCPDATVGWATPDYPFTHEFAHTLGGVHVTSSFEGFTAFAGYPHTIRLGGADVMRMMPMLEMKIQKGLWDGFSECRGDDVQIPPYAAFDFKRFQPDDNHPIIIDVLRNDYDYNRDAPKLFAVDAKTRRGRRTMIRTDSSGRQVVMIEPISDRLGFDMFRYRIADQSGFQSEGYVFLEALRPYRIYEAEDRSTTRGGVGKPRRDKSYISRNVTYVPLGSAPDKDITWKVHANHTGIHGLRFRYQFHGGEDTSASAKVSLSVNGKMLTSCMPLDDTRIPGWWNYCVYPHALLQKGENQITLSLNSGITVKEKKRKTKTRKKIQPLIDHLMVYDGIDYRINFAAGKIKSTLNALLDDGKVFRFHEENGLRYGWSQKGIETFRVIKQRQAPDPAMLTGVCWPDKNRNNRWEIEIPNGTYNVHLTAGGIATMEELETVAGWDINGAGNSINGLHSSRDRGKAPYVNDYLVEGVRVKNTEHERIYSFMDCRTTVTDGRLTIEPGPDARNPRLVCLRISERD